jgi:hypothetical protein
MRINNRCIIFETEEDMQTTIDKIIEEMPEVSETMEDWIDEEFYRIYVTYAYADVTSMQ